MALALVDGVGYLEVRDVSQHYRPGACQPRPGFFLGGSLRRIPQRGALRNPRVDFRLNKRDPAANMHRPREFPCHHQPLDVAADPGQTLFLFQVCEAEKSHLGLPPCHVTS
jgi:hypothetical protein